MHDSAYGTTGPDWYWMNSQTGTGSIESPNPADRHLGGGAVPSASAVSLTDSERIKIVDRFLYLDRKVKEFKPLSDEHEQLKAIAKSWADKLPANEVFTFEGTDGAILLTQRENETVIQDMAQVWKAFGKARFLKLCSMALETLKLLTREERQGIVLVKERTGTRRVEIVAKASPAPALGASSDQPAAA